MNPNEEQASFAGFHDRRTSNQSSSVTEGVSLNDRTESKLYGNMSDNVAQKDAGLVYDNSVEMSVQPFDMMMNPPGSTSPSKGHIVKNESDENSGDGSTGSIATFFAESVLPYCQGTGTMAPTLDWTRQQHFLVGYIDSVLRGVSQVMLQLHSLEQFVPAAVNESVTPYTVGKSAAPQQYID